MPLVFGFTELLGGILLLVSGITAATFRQIIAGQAGAVYRGEIYGGSSSTSSAPTGGSGTASAAAAAGAVQAATVGHQVNPIPGATGSRLDQGLDATAHQFLAPFSGTVKVADAANNGWGGGGYVAIANALNPAQVVYLAEGILPTVSVGQQVNAGQTIGVPQINPYNGIIGNIEIGPANPHNPAQPLAQVVANPAAAVHAFYNWLRGLGGPAATSTALAGHA